jgi:hypothetical protein
MENEQRVTLSASGAATEPGKFAVLAITAGVGNGWEFGADVLKASLPLWEGAQCFVDHALWGHSVRDLAGTLSAPVWDDSRQGIQLTLAAMGPSAELLTEIGRQLLASASSLANASSLARASSLANASSAGSAERVGFSADVVFTAQGRKVQKIVRVHSVDLVIDPARGGAFQRALNAVHWESGIGHLKKEKEVLRMGEENLTSSLETMPQADQKAVQAQLAGEATRAWEMRARMCSYLLDSAVASSLLPPAMAERVRKQFSGKVFDAAELQSAIDDARSLVSELTGAQVVQGPGRIHSMFSSEDQLQAAVDDLFQVQRDEKVKGLHVAKLQGVRELYLMLTGDDDLTGGFHADRVRLAVTSDFTGLVKNAMNKIVVNTWDQLGRAGYTWWEKVALVEHFNTLNQITGVLVGTVGDLPAVAEGAAYNELVVGDSPETASFVKYGGYIPLTLELIDRDQVHKLRQYPRELAAAGLRKISSLVAAIFTQASGVGPTMADGGALFNSTAVTSAGGHANLLTTALSAAQWDVVQAAVFNQPMFIKNTSGVYGSGPKMGINPRYLLVPRALQLTGKQILYPSWERQANITAENQQLGQPGDVVVVPEWTDANDWAAACDPALAPAIFIGERFGLMPQIFIAGDDGSPAVFTNDESRLKVRHFLAVWVNDFRPLHKENVP